MIVKLICFMLLFGSINAHADIERIVETITTQDTLGNIYTSMQASGTDTFYTKSFSVKNDNFAQVVGAMYKATSSGVIALTITPQQSYQRPTTEQTADTTYIDWKVTGATTLATATPGWSIVTLDTVLMPYARFKIVGTGSNDATTKIQIKVGK